MSEPTNGAASPDSSGRLLIVDRDPEVSRLLRVVLARDGYAIDAADGSHAAVDAARAATPDVVLLERTIGLELISELRAIAPDLQAIVMTIDPTVEVQLQALEQGAFDLLPKPFPNLKLLAHRVKMALTTARAIRDRNHLLSRLAAENGALMALEEELGKARDDLARIDPEQLTGVDPTTGVASSRAIQERLKNEAARALRYGRPLSIAVCRIDALPLIVERFGSAAAEEALRGVSALSHAAIREVDVVGRYGDADLLFIFPETAKANGLKVAERLRKLVAQTPVLTAEATNGNAMAVTVSLGIAALPSDTMNADGLLQRARSALVRASQAGTNVAAAFDG